jgi:hypothetical protein
VKLALASMPGEGAGELVGGGTREGYSYQLKHEYPAASWDWTIVYDDRPVDFGVCADRAAAEAELEAAMLRLAPPPPPPPGGLAGMVGRLLWGNNG